MYRAMYRGSLLLLFLSISGQAIALSLGRPASLDVLCQVRLAAVNCANVETWLRSRPFAATLPMQPILVVPLERPQYGISLTFRRKPTSEKGGQDGGLRFAVAADEPEATVSDGTLLVTRNSEGQYMPKIFSERALCKQLISDLSTLPEDCGSLIGVVELPQIERSRE